MHPSLLDWSNVLLMDSLTKQPWYPCRRLLSKQRKSIQRFSRPKYDRKVTSRANKANERNKNHWKKENDTWNTITETLNHQLISTHQIHRRNNDIGIQDNQTNNIQLIHDRQQFNQLMLVDKNGSKICAENLIDPNESDSSFTVKLNFRLIPVIEGITIAKDYVESSYIFDAGINENNDNDETDLNAVEAMEMSKASETDSTLISDMETTSVGSLEFTDMYAKINNTVNISAAPHEYSKFFEDIQSKAALVSRSGNDNVPMFSTPKK